MLFRFYLSLCWLPCAWNAQFFLNNIQEDYNEIVGGWKAKLVRSSSGEQRWGLFIAKKKWRLILIMRFISLFMYPFDFLHLKWTLGIFISWSSWCLNKGTFSFFNNLIVSSFRMIKADFGCCCYFTRNWWKVSLSHCFLLLFYLEMGEFSK